MKKFGRRLLTWLKWTVLTLALVEIACFLLITVTNLLLFGSVWKGSQVCYDPYAQFLNVKGVRPTAHNAEAQEGRPAKHIWMLGGSTTRCEGAPFDESIASYLAKGLNAPGTRQPVVVSNFGENTFNSVMEAKYLQKLLMDSLRPPDLVIFYDGANDCIYFNEYRLPHAHYAYRRLQGPVESYRGSFLGLFKPLVAGLYSSYTFETWDRLRQGIMPLSPDDPALLEMRGAIKRRYDHVQRLTAAYGAKFIVFWQPLMWVETGRRDRGGGLVNARFLKFKENFGRCYDAVAADLEKEPYFVNFQNILLSRREPVYDPDGVHLNGAGNRMVAEAMARVLREREW